MSKYEVKNLFFVSLLPALSRSRLPACSRAPHTPSDALRAPPSLRLHTRPISLFLTPPNPLRSVFSLYFIILSFFTCKFTGKKFTSNLPVNFKDFANR